jgi:hypothetical protein
MSTVNNHDIDSGEEQQSDESDFSTFVISPEAEADDFLADEIQRAQEEAVEEIANPKVPQSKKAADAVKRAGNPGGGYKWRKIKLFGYSPAHRAMYEMILSEDRGTTFASTALLWLLTYSPLRVVKLSSASLGTLRMAITKFMLDHKLDAEVLAREVDPIFTLILQDAENAKVIPKKDQEGEG